MVQIGVVGAGAVGLSSALNVQKLHPDAKVTIIADKFGNETTSSGAAGLFRPTLLTAKGIPLDILKYGYNITTVVTEPKIYLVWLMKKFKDNGGGFDVRTLNSLEELCGQYDVVVNCCGLRADRLVGDVNMKPNRGQLIKVRAPWIRGFHVVEEGSTTTYTIPHSEYLLVGGCRQEGNTSLEIDPVMTQHILDRANKLIPGFQGAEVIGHWAGIRPVREPIRVEKETMLFSGRQLEVVHNYGHGGNGISLSWSTSLDAAQMVKDILDTRTPTSLIMDLHLV